MLEKLKNWLKTTDLKALGGLSIVLALVFILAISLKTSPQLQAVGEMVGNTSSQGERGGTWYVFDQFTGFKTKMDAEKIDDGANSNGQNTTVNGGDRISVRQEGFDVFPIGTSPSSTQNAIKSLHTFRKRDGESILMRTYSTYIEYYEVGNSTWETVSSTYTSGQRFGFGDHNINTDLTSYVYFGNGVDPFSRWTGNHTLTTQTVSAGTSTVWVSSTAGFLASGTITFCGETKAYSSITATSFTLSSPASGTCASSRGVIEAVQTYSGLPRGNIYMIADNRLFIAGVTTTPQAVYFSKYGDATNFTTTTLISDNTDAGSGIFNFGEGGGGVTGMIQDESAIYVFKRSIIRKLTLSDTTYTLGTLKPFDGRSQTVGAVGTPNAIFTSGNEVFFVTPDSQIMRLARVEYLDYPQTTPVSDVIKPTVANADFTNSTGIVFRGKAYFAAKSASDAQTNDTVFVYNLITGTWDSPITGWAVADWTVYDDGSGEKLYWGDGITPNVYQVTNDSNDYVYDVTASWRSKQFTFGLPQVQKTLDSIYVEGYLSQNTTLNISLLLDEDGYTQTYTTQLKGSDSSYIYSSESFNLYGLTPFGFERFGANADQAGKKKFRVYLSKDFVPVPFYNASIEFASDQQAGVWEVTSFGMNVKPFTQQVKPSLMKSFK